MKALYLSEVTLIQWFRRFSKSAWVLHGYLIGCLVVMPFCEGTVHAEGDGWSLTSTESQRELTLNAPDGTANLGPTDWRNVNALLRTRSWEVWTQEGTGATETRNEQYNPIPYASLTQYVDTGSGWGSGNGGSTDWNGNASFSVTGSYSPTLMKVTGPSGEEATLTFSPPAAPEVWSIDRYESMIGVTLESSNGTELAQGNWTQLTATVTHTQWEVQTSNYGNTRTANFTTSPASGAGVSWTQDSGDGWINSWGSSTDHEGKCSVGYSMGSMASQVRAQVSFAASSSASATIQFSSPPPPPPPPPALWFSHMGYATSYGSVSIDGDTHSLSPGTVRTITGQVYQSSWEVWTDGTSTETRNTTSSPASYYYLSVTENGTGGNGINADWSGNFSFAYTMGSVPVTLTLPDINGWAPSFYLTPTPWTHTRTETGTSYSLSSADGSTGGISLLPGATVDLVLTATSWSREIWTDSVGNEEPRNEISIPAVGYTYYLTSESGGTLNSSACMTNSEGKALFSFTMESSSTGSPGSTVVRASPSPGFDSDVQEFPISLTAESWVHTRNEATVSVNLTADGSTVGLPFSTSREITGRVTYQSWELWTSNYGRTEKRAELGGTAGNALVSYSVVSPGDGTLVPHLNGNSQHYTDTNGDAKATFTMGLQETMVRMDVEFAGTTAVGTLRFTPEPQWVQIGNGSNVAVALSDSSGSVTVDVTLETWEIWKRGDETEERNRGAGPANNAAVSLSFAQGTGNFGSASGSTDGNGKFTSSYTLAGTGPWKIAASAQFSGKSGSGDISVTGTPVPTLEITTTGLGDGVIDQVYSSSVAATGGTVPYTWSATGLPGGISINSSTGSISGTPTAEGDYTVSVTVMDASGATDTASFDVTIEPEEDMTDDTTDEPPVSRDGWYYMAETFVWNGVDSLGLPAWAAGAVGWAEYRDYSDTDPEDKNYTITKFMGLNYQNGGRSNNVNIYGIESGGLRQGLTTHLMRPPVVYNYNASTGEIISVIFPGVEASSISAVFVEPIYLYGDLGQRVGELRCNVTHNAGETGTDP